MMNSVLREIGEREMYFGSKVINLTPHQLKIWRADVGTDPLVVEPEPEPARRPVQLERVRNSDLLYTEVVGDVVGLPDPVEGTWYVVSRMVAERAMRHDVLCPGELIRNAQGMPVGCWGLLSLCLSKGDAQVSIAHVAYRYGFRDGFEVGFGGPVDWKPGSFCHNLAKTPNGFDARIESVIEQIQ
jgi:hypothetical protein